MAYYWCWNTSNFVFSNANPTVTKSNFSVKPTFNGKNFTSNSLYRSSATSISSFRTKQRFIFGSGAKLTQKDNIRIYYTTTVSFYNDQILNLTNDITDRFNINVINDTIIDITPLSSVSGSNLTLVIDFNNELAEGGGVFYDLIQNLTNCTSNLSDTKIDESTDKEIILTCDDGFIFDGVPTITIGGNTFDFNLNNDLTVATITVDIIDDVVINAVARANIRVYITGNIVNATCNYSDGELIDVNKNIIITANAGYSFKGAYEYKKGYRYYELPNYGTYLEKTIRTDDLQYDFYLLDDYVATKDIEQLGTFVNLYKTNQTELSELSKVRFSESMGQITDYGSYISSLYILPFEIPSDIIGDKSTILLGNLDSNVESTLISTYSFDFDAGEIEVPLKYNNIYDFVNTECILHLPFLDKVYLNTEYVVGQKLSITFTIELYSGTLTANIKSSFNDEIVASVQGLIGMNIPFIQKTNGNVINSVSNVYKNRNNRCFVEVNRNIPYTKDNNVFGCGVVEYGRIGDYTGYLECDKIVLETNATNQEQEEIKNLLRNGVFV